MFLLMSCITNMPSELALKLSQGCRVTICSCFLTLLVYGFLLYTTMHLCLVRVILPSERCCFTRIAKSIMRIYRPVDHSHFDPSISNAQSMTDSAKPAVHANLCPANSHIHHTHLLMALFHPMIRHGFCLQPA